MKKVLVAVRLTQTQAEKLAMLAVAEKTTRSNVIRRLIERNGIHAETAHKQVARMS